MGGEGTEEMRRFARSFVTSFRSHEIFPHVSFFWSLERLGRVSRTPRSTGASLVYLVRNSSVPGRPVTDCVLDAIPDRGMRPLDLA